MMMRNNTINILLILISLSSLSMAALANDKANFMASDESAKYIQLISADIEVFLFGDPGTYSVDESTNAGKTETATEDLPDEAGIYGPQQALSVNYEGGYVESDQMDKVIEEVIKDINLPGSNSIGISDYRALISQTTGLSPVKSSREKLGKVISIMAEKGNRPEDYRRVLSSVDQKIRNNVDSSAQAAGRTSLTSEDRLKQQSRFLNRIRLKAELSAVPALLLALG